MELVDNGSSYRFSTDRYEYADLGRPDYTVETIDSFDEIMDAMEDSGSCLEKEPSSVMAEYAEKFSKAGNVHFYRVGDQGYARSVELPTSEGDALAVDAVKAGNNFDTEAYRAGVNTVMRHAEALNKDIVLGGKEFFKHRWHKPLDLTLEETATTPAEEVYFDRTVPERDIEVGHREKPFTKGEQWDDYEEFFVRAL
jgi:hypothetical protein